MTAEQQTKWAEWLADKPPAIQKMATLYPPGTKFRLHGKIVHVVSYQQYDGDGETAGVGVSEIDPNVDYPGAVASAELVCECCIDHMAELKV